MCRSFLTNAWTGYCKLGQCHIVQVLHRVGITNTVGLFWALPELNNKLKAHGQTQLYCVTISAMQRPIVAYMTAEHPIEAYDYKNRQATDFCSESLLGLLLFLPGFANKILCHGSFTPPLCSLCTEYSFVCLQSIIYTSCLDDYNNTVCKEVSTPMLCILYLPCTCCMLPCSIKCH